MQQSCTYGSVRGARGNSRPYRDCGRGGRATVSPIPISFRNLDLKLLIPQRDQGFYPRRPARRNPAGQHARRKQQHRGPA